MSYLVLARKWRPTTFDELTGQEPIAGILKNSILGDKVAHAYIFSGPRGVGKTSAARILARTLNCEHPVDAAPCGKCASCIAISDGSSMDVTEIDGASNTGVDNIRDLRERVRYASYGGSYKVYIIDEAHMLSTAAFNALLKTLEEPPPQVIFVLATTDPKKIPATVLSRSQHLPFRRITTAKIKERLKMITAAENMIIEDSALEMVARAADGSMRDSLTILDQVSSFSDEVSAADVKDLLGLTDMETLAGLAGSVISGDRKAVIDIVAGLVESGADLKSFTKDFLQFIRDLLIARITGDTSGILDLSEEEAKAVHNIAQKTNEEHLALILSELVKSEYTIRTAFFPRVALELLLLRLCLMSHFTAIDEAIKILGSAAPPAKTAQVYKDTPAMRKVAPKAAETTVADQVDTVKKNDNPPDEPAAPQQKETLTVDEIWRRVISRIEENNTPLASKLDQGSVTVSDKEISIVFNGGIAVMAESVRESIPLIRDYIKDISGLSLPVRIETREEKLISREDLKDKALNNPVVKEALDLFEGRIAEVYPVKENEGGSNV
jgi:DNA polymerase III subunit gamma/tau